MTPDSEDWNRRNDIDALIANARGVAFAAFGPISAIAGMLGCSVAEAEAFQLKAQDDFVIMQIEAKARRARPD